MSPRQVAERAFIMVWDGMRPDLISPQLTPNLAGLAAVGVRCVDSHAVFPTVTRVNSASLSTGCLPARHGIVGNTLYAPLVDRRRSISVGDHTSLYALIETRGGRLLPCDTVADRVAAAGGRTVVVSSGSPGSAFLCHPRVRECSGDRIYNPAVMLPDGVAARELEARFGPLPETGVPDTALNSYFSRVVTEYVLPELDPRLLIYWHDDPDKAQHHRGFGSPEALEGIRDADANLGRALAALEACGRRETTVVAVVSDHGYVSVEPSVSASEPLIGAGLRRALEDGRLVMSKNGCVFGLNVPNGDAKILQRAAEALLAWPHSGPVFSGARGRTPLAGTLPLGLIGVDGELAPDLLCAMAWDDQPNELGYAGRGAADTVYLGQHGGISSWEIGNTFVLAGCGVKVGLENPLPCGNVDLAPTLLQLLDLEQPQGQQGRILAEALQGGPNPAELETGQETRGVEQGAIRQSLRFSRVGGVRYLDYGRLER